MKENRGTLSKLARTGSCLFLLALSPVAASGMAPEIAAQGPLSDKAMKDRIVKHRMAEVTLTVKDAAGNPVVNQPVTVSQQRHKFLFGSNAFLINPGDASEAQTQYQSRYAALLNYATLPFYWGSYEPTEGKVGFERLRKMAEWCRKNQIRTKGHPLCWYTVVPKWLDSKTEEEVLALEVARVRREVKAFGGLIGDWDVANEFGAQPNYINQPNPISRLCLKTGRVELMKQVFGAAREANPKAVLLINDYDTSARYEEFIQASLDAGVPIDAIGIQSHMHGGYWGAEKTWEVCGRFARLGKPIFFTELTIISGDPKEGLEWNKPYPDWETNPEGEKRQAEQAAEFYRVLFSHPAVQGITWWDFSDRDAWMNAPSGLLRKDMSPKPAYDALMRMIKREWWSGEIKLTSNENGAVTFRGFLGTYSVQCGQRKGSLEVTGTGEATVTVH